MMYIRHHTAGRGTADSSAEQNKKHNQTTHRAKRHPWPISNRQDSKRWSRRAHRVLHLQLAKLGFLILPVVSLAKVPQLSSVGDGFDDTYSTQLRPIQKVGILIPQDHIPVYLTFPSLKIFSTK
ncbi:hypothetical protein PGT21_029289 [Puccinia graminis f. sp. tritici]|uniref:Uncharacterized protein n=1 Tax=Puccinia graminis f. sp. tritici TaxID=56615 RepID=A0A5B0N7R0_PUCGR|nr:hypothetical protein PGT21_029289 [Puccinia graminis f. sp. tritici]